MDFFFGQEHELLSGKIDDSVFYLWFEGDLDSDGLRPIVCLSNKVQFAVKEDNTLEIVNEPAS